MQTDLLARIANREHPLSIDVMIGGDLQIGRLTLITRAALDDTELICTLTRWRNRMRCCFLNQAPVTFAKTRAFLAESVLGDPTRMLFIVHSLTRPAGTIGLKVGPPWIHGAGPHCSGQEGRRVAELANLLRGAREGHPRLMYQSEMALIDWAFRELEMDVVWTAVPSTNRLALTLHQSAGFKSTQLIPLYKLEKEGQTQLTPGKAGEVSPDGLYAQRIELERSDFMLHRGALMEGPEYGTPRRPANTSALGSVGAH